MSDDPLLQKLSRVAREDREAEIARLDERWDALSAGVLVPEEEEELHALTDASPQASVAYEAFRPLGGDFRTRVTEAACFELRADRGEATAPRAERQPAPAPAVVATRRRRPRWWLPGAALAAAAASLLLFLRPTQELPSLPDYALGLDGHVHALRSASESDERRKVFAPGNWLRLILTPNTIAQGPVAARAFSLDADGLRPLHAPPATISEDGAVRIEGEVGGGVRLPGGDSWLLVVVGRAGSLPSGEELSSRLAESGSVQTADWTAWKIPVRLEQAAGR